MDCCTIGAVVRGWSDIAETGVKLKISEKRAEEIQRGPWIFPNYSFLFSENIKKWTPLLFAPSKPPSRHCTVVHHQLRWSLSERVHLWLKVFRVNYQLGKQCKKRVYILWQAERAISCALIIDCSKDVDSRFVESDQRPICRFINSFFPTLLGALGICYLRLWLRVQVVSIYQLVFILESSMTPSLIKSDAAFYDFTSNHLVSTRFESISKRSHTQSSSNLTRNPTEGGDGQRRRWFGF